MRSLEQAGRTAERRGSAAIYRATGFDPGGFWQKVALHTLHRGLLDAITHGVDSEAHRFCTSTDPFWVEARSGWLLLLRADDRWWRRRAEGWLAAHRFRLLPARELDLDALAAQIPEEDALGD